MQTSVRLFPSCTFTPTLCPGRISSPGQQTAAFRTSQRCACDGGRPFMQWSRLQRVFSNRVSPGVPVCREGSCMSRLWNQNNRRSSPPASGDVNTRALYLQPVAGKGHTCYAFLQGRVVSTLHRFCTASQADVGWGHPSTDALSCALGAELEGGGGWEGSGFLLRGGSSPFLLPTTPQPDTRGAGGMPPRPEACLPLPTEGDYEGTSQGWLRGAQCGHIVGAAGVAVFPLALPGSVRWLNG